MWVLDMYFVNILVILYTYLLFLEIRCYIVWNTPYIFWARIFLMHIITIKIVRSSRPFLYRAAHCKSMVCGTSFIYDTDCMTKILTLLQAKIFSNKYCVFPVRRVIFSSFWIPFANYKTRIFNVNYISFVSDVILQQNLESHHPESLQTNDYKSFLSSLVLLILINNLIMCCKKNTFGTIPCFCI